MSRRALELVAFVLLVSSCATTSEKSESPAANDQAAQGDGAAPAEGAPAGQPSDDGAQPPGTTPPPKDDGVVVENKPPEAPPAASAAKPAPKPAGARRSADGIDDDTPLPEKSPAREAFDKAVIESRTSPAKAAPMFLEAAGKTTYFYAAVYNAGFAYERAGDFANAEKYYREALKVRPGYGSALVNLYLLLVEKNREAEADRLIDGELGTHGNEAGPHVAAATRAYRKRDFKTVEAEALRAVRIDERAVPAMRLMATVFYEQGRYGSARFAIENALTLEPGNALLHLQHGHILLKLDEEKKALAAFGKAVVLRPELAEAQENYGILLKRSGDPERALAALQKNAELRPASATAQLHLGNGLRATKKYVEAEAAYKKALELDPSLHAVHFNLGIMYIDNEFQGRDELDRLKLAMQALATFEEKAAPGDKRMKERLKEYRETTEQQITRIEKRREREARRKLIQEAEEEERKAKEAAEKAGGGATPEGAPAPSPGAAKPDSAKPDAAKPDAAKPDAAKPDAAKPDAAKPDDGAAAPTEDAK